MYFGGIMSFGSLVFLVRFLPVTLLLYYLCPSSWRNILLAGASLVFYAWGDPQGLIILLCVAAIGYLAAWGISASSGGARKAVLAAGLTAVLGFLFVFKYADFLLSTAASLGAPHISLELSTPAGISFFTFTVAGYLIDVYKAEDEACMNVPKYLVFVSFFPKLLMGPIVRYREIRDSLDQRTVTSDDMEQGAFTFVSGLAKKVILADGISGLWAEVKAIGFSSSSALLCWTGIAAYALQLYFDFSGYSDMASGLGRFFGFSLPENFRTPYSSVSVTEFWRRWHITMGLWFRQYVYFPLGGSRRGRFRNILNLLAVWALTGLWHGAAWNFVLWGLFYFAVLVLEKQFYLGFLEKNRLIGHIYTIFITLIGWTLFAVETPSQIPVLLSRMFAGSGGVSAAYYLRNYGVLMALCIVLCTEQAASLWKKLGERRSFRWGAVLVLLILSIAYITGSTYQPFLYAQF